LLLFCAFRISACKINSTTKKTCVARKTLFCFHLPKIDLVSANSQPLCKNNFFHVRLTQFVQARMGGKLDEGERDAADGRLGQIVDPGNGGTLGVHLLEQSGQFVVVVVLELEVGQRPREHQGRVGRHQQHAQRRTHRTL